MPALLKCSKERSFTLIKIDFSFTVKLTVMKCVFLFCSFACLFVCLFARLVVCLFVCYRLLNQLIKDYHYRALISGVHVHVGLCVFLKIFFCFFRTKVYHTGNFLFW